MLGDLQTIGPLGVVLHSWQSTSRDAGEGLLCKGRPMKIKGGLGERLTEFASDFAPRYVADAVVEVLDGLVCAWWRGCDPDLGMVGVFVEVVDVGWWR